ncbi:MAG TPA: HAD family hydrolase [Candidatus Aenigmarchaeota archaeon]|nr:HAD family hydrolase [Candidatus Aenigmarchaeota archaeon]
MANNMLLIFDLDGTLVDMHLDIKQIKEDIESLFSYLSIDVSDEYSITGKIEKGCNILGDNILKKSLIHSLEDKEIIAAKKARVYPGVRIILSKLIGQKHILAVFSQNNRKAIQIVLENNDLVKFFTAVVSRDDVSPKPSPEGIYLIEKKCGKKADFIIGDSILDIIAGKKAGIKTVGVLSGYTNAFPEDISPDHIISGVWELDEIICI